MTLRKNSSGYESFQGAQFFFLSQLPLKHHACSCKALYNLVVHAGHIPQHHTLHQRRILSLSPSRTGQPACPKTECYGEPSPGPASHTTWETLLSAFYKENWHHRQDEQNLKRLKKGQTKKKYCSRFTSMCVVPTAACTEKCAGAINPKRHTPHTKSNSHWEPHCTLFPVQGAISKNAAGTSTLHYRWHGSPM